METYGGLLFDRGMIRADRSTTCPPDGVLAKDSRRDRRLDVARQRRERRPHGPAGSDAARAPPAQKLITSRAATSPATATTKRGWIPRDGPRGGRAEEHPPGSRTLTGRSENTVLRLKVHPLSSAQGASSVVSRIPSTVGPKREDVDRAPERWRPGCVPPAPSSLNLPAAPA
jgi:hypothetical protein